MNLSQLPDNLYAVPPQGFSMALANERLSLAHTNALMRGLYHDRAPHWYKASSYQLPKTLQHWLSEKSFALPTLKATAPSAYDLSVKFGVTLSDGKEVECVLMPEKRRITLCISSQVGCAQKCSFCHTGRMGLSRNLETHEIVGQVVAARNWMMDHPEWLDLVRREKNKNVKARIDNVVFMGMGEPFANTENVIDAVSIMLHTIGLGLGPRQISVSTVGLLDGLNAFTRAHPKVRVAISLHETRDDRRARIVPRARETSIADLLDAVQTIYELSNNESFIQYTLIRGVNDSHEHAHELVALLKGRPVKVNVIPLNEIRPSRFERPSDEDVYAFCNILKQNGLLTLVRLSKGRDINAGCGQLVSQLNRA